jgi:4-oxalocrotonate tautomerase
VPHAIVKLWPGKSEAQKRDLTAAIVRETGRILNFGRKGVAERQLQRRRW